MIHEHPERGTILICDYDVGFKEPEMVKRRPVLVVSPKISVRPGLCTIVALSTSPPAPELPYHCKLTLSPALPAPWVSDQVWVKADMINAVGFHRLDFVRLGKDRTGKRIYRYDTIPAGDLQRVQACILKALGLAALTSHMG